MTLNNKVFIKTASLSIFNVTLSHIYNYLTMKPIKRKTTKLTYGIRKIDN